MFHLATFCDMCGYEIVGEDYDERHWSEDGISEYHASCCPECPGVHDPEVADAMSEWYGWDRISQEIMDKEDPR